MLLTILIILLVLAIVGGGWGHNQWGLAGWSPVGLILLIALILWLAGVLPRGLLH